MQRMHLAGKPFFMWVNFTHMHMRTHTKPESIGRAGRWQSPDHDTMVDHDRNVGTVLDKLDELGLADDTIVLYGTDNGPHANTWPDGGDERCSAAKEHQLGRAHSVCPGWRVGLAGSSPVACRRYCQPS